MTHPPDRQYPLALELAWFIRLRWLAGTVVLAAAGIDWRWLGWYVHSPRLLAVGLAILAYNLLLWWVLRPQPAPPRGGLSLRLLAWAQLLLDMACLTLLAMQTGGVRSPLIGFFVFHMVFASLLLPRTSAYAGACAAILMLCCGLWFGGQWPIDREDVLLLMGVLTTLVLTVYLANHITRGLRRQNRRIRKMSQQLRLHQQAMIQHEKMVAMGQMAAGVTHEIANPLASMDSMLQLMQRKPDRLRPQSIATLRQQVERIHQIVQQMKAFAHPIESQLQMASLNEVIDGAITMVGFDPRLARVRIERQFSPDVGQIFLLPQALQQVIVNLILNALDALAQTPEPRLSIHTERKDGWCVVEVADNGPGIAPQHINRVFEPFFTTKPVGKGTGLGLSISYSLIQKHGGNITVRSQPQQGAIFIIHLPATQTPLGHGKPPGHGIVLSENSPA